MTSATQITTYSFPISLGNGTYDTAHSVIVACHSDIALCIWMGKTCCGHVEIGACSSY